MTHSHSRKNSSNAFFRMDVPKDIRDLAGVTSWQITLKTSDPTLADVRRASYVAHYKAEVIRLRLIKKNAARENAAILVGRALDRLAGYFNSMDDAVSAELHRVALIVRSSWSVEHAIAAEAQFLGEPQTNCWAEEPVPVPSIDGEEDRRLFRIRAELFEGKDAGTTDGLVYQELANALLVRGVYHPLEFAVSYLPYLVPEIDLSTPAQYDAIAEAYLTRLATHTFASWPEGLRQALVPVAAPQPAQDTSLPAPAAAPLPITLSGKTLREALAEWKRSKGITGPHKTAAEFEKAITRFEELCGVADIALITSRMVKAFRNQVAGLPAQPPRAIATLPLLEQIELAKAKSLPTLMPPSVNKQIVGIRAILAAAVEAEWIETNPAQGVTVEGSKWVGDERDHFSDEDMRRIYASPLMTDPDACEDTMFWILFLAPFHGSRPGEHCKLKPHEIVQDDGEWIMRFRRDRRVRKNEDGSVPKARRQKTNSSVRDVPVHWIVLEAGFIEFCQIQAARGAEWLFDDLKPDMFGDRYKELSRLINRALRKLGINDLDKAFYSTRHTMKREGRRRRVSAQSLNQLAGHSAKDVGDRYGQGAPIETLKSDIDNLEFRSVPWDAVVDCARIRVARLQARYEIVAT